MPLTEIKQLLIPTDLSPFGLASLRYADLFHERFGARAMVVYANEPLYPMVGFSQSLGVDWNSNAVHEDLDKRLRESVAKSVRNPDAYDVAIVDDTAPLAIADTAKAMHADLIIMGTHGRTGWRRAILGSVAERVLHDTEVPLMTVNAAAAASQRIAIESILCPVNFTTVAHDALRYASGLAGRFDARLLVLNVEDEEAADVDVTRDFEGWVDATVRDHCDYRRVVARGNPADTVLDIASQFRTDLIVVGAQHRRFSDATAIGTTTEQMTRFAWQPVLTVMRRPVERAADVAA